MTGLSTLGPAALGFLPQNTGGGSGGLPSGLESATVSPRAGLAAPVYSPDNPMFWFGVLLVAATGFIVFSGRVKVGGDVKAGPVKGSVTV